MIILDDVESLPYNYQEQLILQYLRFYTCMRNLPDIDDLDKKIIMSIYWFLSDRRHINYCRMPKLCLHILLPGKYIKRKVLTWCNILNKI